MIGNQRFELEVVEEAIEKGNQGFCTACGEQQDGCEPDARDYQCEACGQSAVYGAEELVLMGRAS